MKKDSRHWMAVLFSLLSKNTKSEKRRVALVASCGIADYQQDKSHFRCGMYVALCGISPTGRVIMWH
jgi:hypothetical protein